MKETSCTETAIANLFEYEHDAINIIKQKEIYETLEGADR